MSAFKFVRRYKNKHIKRNRLVMYDGALMRIANTSGDGLKLRKEVICHANDPALQIVPSESYLKAVEALESAVESWIAQGGVNGNEDTEAICKHMRGFVKALTWNVSKLDQLEESEK